MKTALSLAALLLALLTLKDTRAAPEETSGFLPKDSLGVTALAEEAPEADGRGVLVAVLDTGVDLLHPSLATNPDGSAKVVDFFDGTDAGTVETATAGLVSGGLVTGLSGRKLATPPGLPDEVRLGLVRAKEIYPGRLLRRLRQERGREREHARRVSQDRAAPGKGPPAPPDPGDPVHDLVLWSTDDGWRTLVDTDADGDLRDETVLREYPVEKQVAVLTGGARLGFGVRVLRSGDAVSLLFDGGGHGTHVAGIIAGFVGPDSPLNGLAPSASILAVKIGNGRYGGPTTHLAMVRGLEWAGRAGADVVNISFGGPSLFADGREILARTIDEMVAKYGYAVCVSAGNAGPALTTVGAPATSRRAISVGAWCPKETMISNYGAVAPAGGALFGFSSRGPLGTGGTGVDFIAPGAAVSAVPEWALVAGENMNGTSMAAPQASGAIAALLSAARAEGLSTSPTRILEALRTGARYQPGLPPVYQGYGLLDVAAALRALRERKDGEDPVLWRVDRPTPNGPGRGFLARESTGEEPIPVELRIAPDFPEDVAPETKARFRRMLRLTTDAGWLEVASPTHASSEGASVRAVAHPDRMAEGLNSTLIRVVDIVSKREVARVPVTVIRPRVVPGCDRWTRETIHLSRGDTRSLFVLAPPGATMARVEARETAADDGTRISLRTVDHRVREKGVPRFEERVPGKATVIHQAVREGTTLEIAFHRGFRAPPGESVVDVAVAFKGLSAAESSLVIPAGRLGTHLNLRAGGRVKGRFRSSLEWLATPLPMTFTTRKAADAPEILGEETLFEHEGTATFRAPERPPEMRIDLRFENPYEDYVDDAVWAVEDANGMITAKGHIWRGPFSFKPPRRGVYTLRILVWERGRRFFRNGALFSPVLLTRTKRRTLPVRQDAFEGFAPGGPAGDRFDLMDGVRTAALLQRPKGDGTVVGEISFRDEDWGVDLLTLPVRVEPPSLGDREKELETGFAALLEDEIVAALDAEASTPERIRRVVGLVAIARAAGKLEARHEAALHLLRARLSPEESRAALPKLSALVERLAKSKPEERRAAHRARCEAAILAGDLAKAKADLSQSGGDDETTRRLRFLLAQAEGKPAETLKALDRLREKAPPSPGLERARFGLLLATGRTAEARRLLLDWTERFPRRIGEVGEMAESLAAKER